MRYIVDGVHPSDIDDVVSRLSDDARAGYEAFQVDPRRALIEALQLSHVRAIVKIDEQGEMEVLCLSGWWDNGYIWLTTTKEFFEHASKIVRILRDYADVLTAQFGTTFMYVDVTSKVNVRFARFLGFRFFEQHPESNFATFVRSHGTVHQED